MYEKGLMMKEIVQKVKGTRDFYPEDMILHHWLGEQIRAVSELFGYQAYEGPYLEKLELYAAKSGEELVKEQSYVFTDRGGGEICLRPELTPTLARMVAQKGQALTFPLRLWSFGPFWRYEQPQKGRSREFFQWNIDMIGANGAQSDAELIAVCATFFQRLGLTEAQVRIHVNDRRLMDRKLAEIGVPEDEKALIYRLIDRRDKMRECEWKSFAAESGVGAETVAGLTTILNDGELWRESEELTAVFELLEAMGLAAYLEFDAKIIRGLLYYTGMVFEAKDVDGGRAILGGGRYENLVGDVGGDLLPGVGFAMGDVMIKAVLEKLGILPALDAQPAKVVVTVFDAASLGVSAALAMRLRGAGIPTILYPEAAKLNKQLKYADRIGATAVIICGPDELANGMATVKNLAARSQRTVSIDALAGEVKGMVKIRISGVGVS